ncbi:FMRFamide peptide receptor frpr-18-like [Lineus longissimus]|uniref:FMRFamide peptide receptor frpr-18-like n=1 Tax=Lineus longissimus TaxID=88925 RepID=UPI00315C879A
MTNISASGGYIIAYPTTEYPLVNRTLNITSENGTDDAPDYNFVNDNNFYDKFTPMVKIDQFITPIWYALGVPGNFLAFVVWMQRQMRHSSGVYLATLALVDLCFLLLHIIHELDEAWGISTRSNHVLCSGYPVLFLAVQYMSPVLVLGFTVERYISVCHPFQREKYCTVRRATKVVALLIVISLSLAIIQGYFYKYYPERGCAPRDAILVGDTKSLWFIWTWLTEPLVFALVPLVVLIFNILVIIEARKLSKAEPAFLNSKTSQKTSATTIMLLAVSFYLIFTTLPITIVYALYLQFPPGSFTIQLDEVPENGVWHRHFVYGTIRTCLQEFAMSHYACKFYIYCITGKAFRVQLINLFGRICCKKDRVRGSDYWLENSKGTTNASIRHQNGTCV